MVLNERPEKRFRRYGAFLILWLFLILAGVPANAWADGWKTAPDGKKYYYAKGKPVIGRLIKIGSKKCYFDEDGKLVRNEWISWKGKTYRATKTGRVYKDRVVKIDGKYYYFRKSGARASGWITWKGRRYHFGEDGAADTGFTAIGKYSYLFTGKGVMLKGEQNVGTTTYYLSDRGRLTMRVEHGTSNVYYNASGKQISNAATWDLEARFQARKVISQVTNSSMSKGEKLLACFRWVITKPYVTLRNFSNFDGWPALYANDHFLRGRGNCQADAAAFAYLARELGYKNVYVCADSSFTDMSRNILAHSWTEINGLVYDPLFAEDRGFNKHYGGSYSSYGLYPILHIKIS